MVADEEARRTPTLAHNSSVSEERGYSGGGLICRLVLGGIRSMAGFRNETQPLNQTKRKGSSENINILILLNSFFVLTIKLLRVTFVMLIAHF